MSNLGDRIVGWISVGAAIYLFLTPWDAHSATTHATISFLPISIKVCDAWRKQRADEILITISYKQGKWPFQYVNQCLWQRIK